MRLHADWLSALHRALGERQSTYVAAESQFTRAEIHLYSSTQSYKAAKHCKGLAAHDLAMTGTDVSCAMSCFWTRDLPALANSLPALSCSLTFIVKPGQIASSDAAHLKRAPAQDVRGRIAAIPQEPILFSGTIRSNVDPYDQHEDHEIWTALERVDLKACPGCHAPSHSTRHAAS